MKNFITSTTLLFLAATAAFSQGDNKVLAENEKNKITEGIVISIPIDSNKNWNYGGIATFNFSQVALNNWAGGGVSSITTTGLLNLNAVYAKNKASWVNSLDMAYGIIKNKNVPLQKSDDRIELNSKFGRKASKDWYYSALMNFRTQFAPGFNAPGDTVKISNIFAPAYVITALGMDYKPNANFSAFIAPFTSKITIVNDPFLSAAGAFGVEAGETFRSEVGSFIKVAYQKDVMENVGFTTKIDLFSNYLNNPQNIDINWEVLLNMKVNKYITTSVSTLLIYDDDIDIAVDNDNDGTIDGSGPRVQFKEVLAIGLAYKF